MSAIFKCYHKEELVSWTIFCWSTNILSLFVKSKFEDLHEDSKYSAFKTKYTIWLLPPWGSENVLCTKSDYMFLLYPKSCCFYLYIHLYILQQKGAKTTPNKVQFVFNIQTMKCHPYTHCLGHPISQLWWLSAVSGFLEKQMLLY